MEMEMEMQLHRYFAPIWIHNIISISIKCVVFITYEDYIRMNSEKLRNSWKTDKKILEKIVKNEETLMLEK